MVRTKKGRKPILSEKLNEELKELRKRASREKQFKELEKKRLKFGTSRRQKLTRGIRDVGRFLGEKRKALKPKRKRGRPKGSFDPRFSRFGGVQGFRKFQRQKRRLELLEAQRRSRVSPQEEIILQRIRNQRRQQTLSPEQQPIPDTTGVIPLRGINQEIDDAANLVR
jgi:hypothetical protein